MCIQCGQLLTLSTLILASLDRYFAIFQPYFYAARCKSPLIAIKALFAIWIICGVISLLGLVTPKFMQYHVVLLAEIIALIPFSIVLHIKAYLIVRRIDNRVHCQNQSEIARGTHNNAKTARITGVILTGICFCYFPQAFALVSGMKVELDTVSAFILSTMVLVMLYSTINPIIYCFQLESFKKDLEKLWSRILFITSKRIGDSITPTSSALALHDSNSPEDKQDPTLEC